MTCPLCKKPAHPDYRPFCGRAHRDRDLLRWLGEGYRIPGRPLVDEDEANGGAGLDSPTERD
ncbi:DNA gyrase inhibitor YacG [uncultured Sphingomonas sp.]|uniref:DNA gyrase inhibitor YacG n=1 Tax=uncultured Sphingomonas sp. TaxID=158754 RepID=UPI0035C984DB